MSAAMLEPRPEIRMATRLRGMRQLTLRFHGGSRPTSLLVVSRRAQCRHKVVRRLAMGLCRSIALHALPGARLSIPNLITLARILSVPVMVWAIMNRWMLAAFLLFLAAGVSDAIDGYLAKRLAMTSELGPGFRGELAGCRRNGRRHAAHARFDRGLFAPVGAPHGIGGGDRLMCDRCPAFGPP